MINFENFHKTRQSLSGFEEYKIVNRGRKGNDYHVISVHYSHHDAQHRCDQLQSKKARLNIIVPNSQGEK